MTDSRLVNSHHFSLWWDSSRELAGCVLSWLPLLLECKVMSNQATADQTVKLPHEQNFSAACNKLQVFAFYKKPPDDASTRTPIWRNVAFTDTEWKPIGLSSIKQRTLKKTKKKKQRNVVNFHFLKEAVQTENFQSNSRKRNFEKEHSRFRPHTKKKSWNVSWVIRNNQLGDKKPSQSCVYTYIWHCLSITITHTGN